MLVVVDTSIWVDHFRKPNILLSPLLAEGLAALHPFVFGELALGGLPSQSEIAVKLLTLPRPQMASPSEAAAFISWAQLTGTGIGYVDAHLLLAAKLEADGYVLTKDKKLAAQAERLGVAHTP